MDWPQYLVVKGDMGEFHPHGECTLVEAVEAISAAVAYCRDRKVHKLLVVATDLFGISIPTLVDRFLLAEEWAGQADGMVAMALVVYPEYIHPNKFGVMVATDFGMLVDVHTTEVDALEWLSNAGLVR